MTTRSYLFNFIMNTQNIIIYSKSNCTFCDAAKMFLKMRYIEYQVKQLDIDFSQQEIKDLYPTARSYPIIVIDNTYIGGYQELKEYFKQ